MYCRPGVVGGANDVPTIFGIPAGRFTALEVITDEDLWQSIVGPARTPKEIPVVEVEVAVTTIPGMDTIPEENVGSRVTDLCDPEEVKEIFVKSILNALDGCECGPLPPENMVVTTEGAWEARPGAGLVEFNCKFASIEESDVVSSLTGGFTEKFRNSNPKLAPTPSAWALTLTGV